MVHGFHPDRFVRQGLPGDVVEVITATRDRYFGQVDVLPPEVMPAKREVRRVSLEAVEEPIERSTERDVVLVEEVQPLGCCIVVFDHASSLP